MPAFFNCFSVTSTVNSIRLPAGSGFGEEEFPPSCIVKAYTLRALGALSMSSFTSFKPVVGFPVTVIFCAIFLLFLSFTLLPFHLISSKQRCQHTYPLHQFKKFLEYPYGAI